MVRKVTRISPAVEPNESVRTTEKRIKTEHYSRLSQKYREIVNKPYGSYDNFSEWFRGVTSKRKERKIPFKRELPGITGKSGVFLIHEILCSPAWWELTATAIKVYLTFRLKCRIVGQKDSKKMHVPVGTIKNNGELVFSYKEAASYGIGTKTFTDAIDLLMKFGFIDIKIPGSYPDRKATYSVSDRWREFGTDKFKEMKRDHRKYEGEDRERFLEKMGKREFRTIEI